MITHKELEQYILSLNGSFLDYPFGEEVAVYKINNRETSVGKGEDKAGPMKNEGKMFALIDEKSDPVRLSLKCDPQLAVILREKYETVLPGRHLNKKHWNTIICTGQVGDVELKSLIVHSYELVRSS